MTFQQDRNPTTRRYTKTPLTEGSNRGDAKLPLAELLFGQTAETAALSRSAHARTQSPTPPIVEEVPANSSEIFITSYRLNVTEYEARERTLVKNKERQIAIRSELKELEEEEDLLNTALKVSKAERKQLRSSISTRDLHFLQLGQDPANAEFRRMRFDDSGDE
ncbi:hypothetical protein N0V86_005469 [Didymella sp. IMI 355093]|nr:hypothetical protein N0V86_005469 [Didymella sp. IMI 355093]